MSKIKKEKSSGSTEKIATDPFGSYTGCPADKSEVPVQDADDL